MARIRILLANLPRLLTDIIRGIIDAHPDLDVVGEVAGRDDLITATGEYKADIVVLGIRSERELPSPNDELLRTYPRLRVVGVDRDGRAQHREFGVTDPAVGELVDLIRGGGHPRASR